MSLSRRRLALANAACSTPSDSTTGAATLTWQRKSASWRWTVAGIVMVEVPEMETLFDADGYMRQYLPNNTMLELNKKTGGCEVFHKGEKVRRYENVEVAEIENIQSWALALR